MTTAEANAELLALHELAKRQSVNPYNKERHTRVIFGEMAERLEVVLDALRRRRHVRSSKESAQPAVSRSGTGRGAARRGATAARGADVDLDRTVASAPGR